MATGIRVPVALAFNARGDLFNTDQEGETWMPDGNPFDELNHIEQGKNYGFPPPHPQWLPQTIVQQPVVNFGPQHQSACGLVFNTPQRKAVKNARGAVALPVNAEQALFGPELWKDNAFVAGESRGKIYRVELQQTAAGYLGRSQTIARLSMLTVDMAISPRGEMYVACHSGPPDWGTGPSGKGKIFKISYSNPGAPVLVSASPSSITEVRLRFNTALYKDVAAQAKEHGSIEFGEYVSAGDRHETLKPPYIVVAQQDATPRGKLRIQDASLEEGGRVLVLKTDPHPLAVKYAARLRGIRSATETNGVELECDYDFVSSSQPLPERMSEDATRNWNTLVAWAPKGRASGGTNSRPPQKPDGDWETGRSLFFSQELNCAKCHRVRGEGGLAGPDLSNLIHRDVPGVLRDITEPSTTIHPDYVTYQVQMKDGDVLQGFIKSQESDVLRLFDAEGKETVIKRADVASVKPTELSLMPSGLLEGRSTNGVRDLLTFLLWEPPQHRSPKLNGKKLEPNKRAVKFVLVAGKKDHGKGQHDYPVWQEDWLKALNDPAQQFTAEKAWEWPTKEQFESATAIAFYYWNHTWTIEKLEQLSEYLKRGGGLLLIHSAVISQNLPEELAKIIGLSAHPQRVGYRHMPFDLLIKDRNHEITKGFPERLDLLDEPYWPLIGDPRGVHLIAAAKVDGEERPLIWVREADGGRVFCSIPGHYTWSHKDGMFRDMLMRGLAWVARVEPEYLRGR